MKTCTKCGQAKLPDDFVKNRRGWCCACPHAYVQVLGTLPDSQVAARFRHHEESVRLERVALGILSFRERCVSRLEVNGVQTKLCTKCMDRKPLTAFPNAKCGDGFAAECKICRASRVQPSNREYHARNSEQYAERYRANLFENRVRGAALTAQRRHQRYVLIDSLKSVPCLDCGITFPPCVMDFDHLDGDAKVSNVNRLVGSAPWDVVLAEIAKCALRCACCHRLKSWVSRTKRPEAKLSKKRELVRSLKAKPCVVCAKSFHPCQMDFDHVRGVKRGEVSQLTSLSREEILEEVGKCDVVCANCHRIRTNSRPQGNRRLSSEGVVRHA